jgi:hypothetical protein
MHYIIGTNISVGPDPKRGFIARENQFTVNIPYKLTSIVKQNEQLVYTFIGVNQSQVTLTFDSARSADSFIAKIRNEVIPDYTKEIGKLDV